MGVAQAVQTFDGKNSFINGINSVTMCQFAYHAKFWENTSASNVGRVVSTNLCDGQRWWKQNVFSILGGTGCDEINGSCKKERLQKFPK